MVAEVGDNSRLPADHGEALKYVFGTYRRIVKNRKWCAARMRDVFTDAKASGFSGDDLREAIRLQKMTPEKRLEWANRFSKHAARYGYAVIQTDTDADPDPVLQPFLERAAKINREKAEVRDELKNLTETVKTYNVDKDPLKQINFEHIKLLSKIQDRAEDRDDDPNAAPDTWFATLDSTATFLALW